MEGQKHADRRSEGDSPLLLARLLPAGAPATIAEIVEGLGMWERPRLLSSRPRVLLNMVASVDGRATLEGRSGPLSDRADRELFHGLRSAVDAVMVGAGTVRVERYGRLIADASRRRSRSERGMAEEPLACIVSSSLELDELPLLREPSARVVLLTASTATLAATDTGADSGADSGAGASIEYVRAADSGRLDLGRALRELRERFAVELLLCEGGPHLAAELIDAGLVDELFLSISPQLAGEQPSSRGALRILAGLELAPPVELELLGVLQGDSSLFLRYGVSACGRVSRATIPSSSLAS